MDEESDKDIQDNHFSGVPSSSKFLLNEKKSTHCVQCKSGSRQKTCFSCLNNSSRQCSETTENSGNQEKCDSTSSAVSSVFHTHDNGSTSFLSTKLQDRSSFHKQPSNISKVNKDCQDCDSDSSDNDEYVNHCVYTYKGSDLPLQSSSGRNPDTSACRSSSSEMDYLEMDFDPGTSNGHDCSDDSTQSLHINECCFQDSNDNVINYSPCMAVSSFCNSSYKLYSTESSSSNVKTSNSLPSCLPKDSETCRNETCSHEGIDNIYLQEEGIQSGQSVVSNDRVSNSCYSSSSDRSKDVVNDNSVEKSKSDVVTSARPLELDEFSFERCSYECCRIDGENYLIGDNSPEILDFINQHIVMASHEINFDFVDYQPNKDKDDSFETSFNNGLSSGEGDNEDNEEDDEPWNFVNDDRLARFIIQNAEYDSSFYATISDCKNNIYSRWFPTYPRKSFDLCRFLLHWLSRGAHCVMTLNNVGKTQSNSNWFHYCVYAVNETKIIFYPHLVCTEKEIKEHLSSSPNIIISRDLILKFWTPNSNIQALVNYPSEEWKTYNVLGQLVNLLREEVIWNDSVSTNIKVPSSCSPGITVLINMENPYLKELKEFPELPSDVDNFCASLIIGECR